METREILLCVLCFLALSGMAAMVSADSIPFPPNQFYGNVTLNGVDAPAGTIIDAYIDDEFRGSIEIGTAGEYGYDLNYLDVSGGDPDHGNMIIFRVAGVLANETAVWYRSEAPRKLDLSAEDYEAPEVTDPDANPPSILSDEVQTSQLNVTVTDNSTVGTVTVDLSGIGGLSAQAMEHIGDGVYTTTTTAAMGTEPGTYCLPVTATDTAGNSDTTECIELTVVERESEVYLKPYHSSVSYSSDIEIELWVNATSFQSGQINLAYDPACANVTNCALNTATFPISGWDSSVDGREWITFGALTSLTGEHRIATLAVQCVCEDDCRTLLDFVYPSALIRSSGTEVPVNWVDGIFECSEIFGLKTFYRDADGDGYGNSSKSIRACFAPTGYVSDNTDCDDTDPDVNGMITFYRDADGDGYGDPADSVETCSVPDGYVSDNTDCDDTNADVNPGATEVCNGIDDDCDGEIDEALTMYPFYRDADGDGYGDPADTTESCTAPDGYVADNTDCDDNNVDVNPGATEVCNGIDDDCDGEIDEGVKTTFYRDADGDGYGDPADTTESCTAPDGYVADNTDCDDNNADVNPGATEVCNGIDDDCDGEIDEGVKTTFYRDADGDSYGDPADTTESCTAPDGYVADNTDCDDNNADVNPGATEVCNGIDDDCDGEIDEGLITYTFYRDADGDGYGNPAEYVEACCKPIGYVPDNTDCDDTDADVNPGATEVCNGIDDDCDGEIDESVMTTFYRDADGDGYGDPADTTESCTAPDGYVSDNTDCDDTNADVNPGATEVCNGIDDNCDGVIDEGCVVAAENTVYFKPQNSSTSYCNTTEVEIWVNVTDEFQSGQINLTYDPTCADVVGICMNTAIFPISSLDSSVDGREWLTFMALSPLTGEYRIGKLTIHCNCEDECTTALDFVDPSVLTDSSGAEVPADWIDGDFECAEIAGMDTFYRDADGDGYGNSSDSTEADTAPEGYVADNTDCNDTNADVNPGATEVCNGIDDDCDGEIDEGVKTTFCRDSDGDGYGDPADTTESCTAPEGYVADNTDCNDTNPGVNPGATEICCNGIDDDCDGEIDEGVNNTYYRDADGDGYGNSSDSTEADTAPEGYVADNTDCNDTNAGVNPGATEIYNGIDDDCDGEIDEGCEIGWIMEISSEMAGDTPITTNLTYGVGSSATDGFDDGLDKNAPPADPSGFNTYFHELGVGTGELTVDIKSLGTTRNWTLIAVAPATMTVNVTWIPADILPDVEMEMQELDLGTGEPTGPAIDMKTEGLITVTGGAFAPMTKMYRITATTE